MARKPLDQELAIVVAQIVSLGAQIKKAFTRVLQALEHTDISECEEIIAADKAIDTLRQSIERRAFLLMTIQQPLGGKDLRFLTAILPLVADLERIGDGVAGIAKMLLTMATLHPDAATEPAIQDTRDGARQRESSTIPFSSSEPSLSEASLIQGLVALGKEALQLFQGTMQAFALKDVEIARQIWKEDDLVDVRYHMVRHDLMKMLSGIHGLPALQQDVFIMQRVTYYLSIAHKFERVGDHCTNMCERIVFMIEGDRNVAVDEENI